MTGYVRKDTTNNIADGNIINASDLDAEFDGVQDAFNASTGHKHDGTSGEGAPITAVGPVQDVVVSTTAVTPKTTNTVDLGSSSLKFKDIFIAGAASLPTVNATTVDTTNIEVTAIKAKDGTASATIADSTGVMTIASSILTTADINGGTIDATAIGGVTPAAGAFTTLSSTGNTTIGDAVGDVITVNGTTTFANANPTLSAGTANGVAYLNGSKVLTTGSALTFDGTNLATTGSLGVGAAADANHRAYIFASGNGIARLGNSTTDVNMTGVSGVFGTNVAQFGGQMAWSLVGSEQMRLTSTGLGIGTSSPGSRLAVLGSANMAYFYDGSTSDFQIQAVSSRTEIGPTTNTPLSFKTNNTERMRLDSSGNLGLGVTPSSWASSYKSFQLGSTASLVGATNFTFLNTNVYFDSSDTPRYLTTAAATRYQQDGGAHKWFNAPSGTTGNAISFTQAMTLDASGNLGVGVTSPGYRGHFRATGTSSIVRADRSENNSLYLEIGADGNGGIVNGSPAVLFQTAGTERLRLDASGNLGLGVTPSAWNSGYKVLQTSWSALASDVAINGGTSLFTNARVGTASASDWRYLNSAAATRYLQQDGVHAWYTAPSGTAGNAISFTQAMTLDASGNLGVGVTSIQRRLHLGGGANDAGIKLSTDTSGNGNLDGADITFTTTNSLFITNRENGAMVFETNGSERARIDSSGNFGIGTSSPAAKLEVSGGASSITSLFKSSSGTATNITLQQTGVRQWSIQLPASSNDLIIKDDSAGAERARIDSVGRFLVGWTDGTTIPNSGYYVSPNGFAKIGNNAAASGWAFYEFARSGSVIGSITQSGTTTVAYNTSSDYRLKDNIAPMTGALAKVQALKPCTYKWKADGSDGEGFIAHELAEVVPQCVTGEKDAVDAEGKPVYQGIDTSFLVATLTAALQELHAKVEALEARLASDGPSN